MTPRPASKLWLPLLAISAGVLVWLVTTKSLASYLASAAPESALRLHPAEAKALLNIADARLSERQPDKQGAPSRQGAEAAAAGTSGTDKSGDRLRLWAELAAKTAQEVPGHVDSGSATKQPPGSQGPDAYQQVRNLVQQSLAADPLNVRGLTMLGELAHLAGDEAEAEKFFRVSAQRSLRERVAAYWLMLAAFQRKDYAVAVQHADALLRTRSDVSKDVMPLLAYMAENKDARDEVKKALLANPPWRSSFLTVLAQASADPRTAVELLLVMRSTGEPPTADDLRNNVRALVARGQYDLAYFAWLEYLPPAHLTSTGLLFNGSFELTPSGVPFDWSIGPGVGATVEIADDPEQDGRRALLIDFGYGRVEFPAVLQLIVLAPGTYLFKGREKGELVGKRGLVWRIACAERPDAKIGESGMTIGVYPKWREFDFGFTVPATDCRTQVVRLQLDARMPSEQLVTGAVWYDDLRIVPRARN